MLVDTLPPSASTDPAAALPPPPTGAALAYLRQATSVEHAAIEQQLALEHLRDLAHYGTVLAGFERFLRQWEPRLLAAWPERLHSWFQARSRLALVRADLQALGLAPHPDFDDTPAVSQLPLPDMAAAWGSLYVLEGSALGGQVIARMLAQRWGLHGGNGAAYFIGFGERTGALWREFRQLADQALGPQPAHWQSAGAAARATFAALSATFNEVAPS